MRRKHCMEERYKVAHAGGKIALVPRVHIKGGHVDQRRSREDICLRPPHSIGFELNHVAREGDTSDAIFMASM
jgi:hypothetical protein